MSANLYVISIFVDIKLLANFSQSELNLCALLMKFMKKLFLKKRCFIALRCTMFTWISSKNVPDTSLHDTTNLM
jgi:hypothetical protein